MGTLVQLTLFLIWLSLTKGHEGDDVTTADAVIYHNIAQQEGGDGSGLHYIEHPNFADFGSMLQDNGHIQIGSLCVTGAWIIYAEPQYDSNGPDDFAVVSGQNNCIQPGSILSMQPLGNLDSPFGVSMTLFPEKQFGDMGVPITGTRGRRFMESLRGVPKSLIVVGKSQWTIETKKGKDVKSYCLATNFDANEATPICLVPDLEALGILTPDPTHLITSIGKGCRPNVTATNVFLLEDCRYFGARYPDPNQADKYRYRVLSDNLYELPNATHTNVTKPGPGPPPPPTKPKLNLTCPGGKAGPDVLELVRLLQIRLQHDFLDPSQLLWPENPAHMWKTEILDMIYDIAMDTVPPELVPQEYLGIMREFTVYHLSNAWKNATKGPEPVPEILIQSVHNDLERCGMLLNGHEAGYMMQHRDSWMKPGPKSMFNQFMRTSPVDITIDTTYVIGNMVLGICHHMFDFTNNFWANFIHVFNILFLVPLVEDWRFMGEEEEYILGGFDYETMYQKLAAFATNTVESVPNLQPFERLPGVVPEIPLHLENGTAPSTNPTETKGASTAEASTEPPAEARRRKRKVNFDFKGI